MECLCFETENSRYFHLLVVDFDHKKMSLGCHYELSDVLGRVQTYYLRGKQIYDSRGLTFFFRQLRSVDDVCTGCSDWTEEVIA